VIFAENFASASETFLEKLNGAPAITGLVEEEGQVIHRL